MYDGILLIDKGEGMTSYDVIRRIKPQLPRKHKVGHAGTLDPFATGLLIVTLGKGTKLFDAFQEKSKKYSVIAELGYETDTYDVTGQKVFEDREYSKKVSIEKLEDVLANFQGEILQKPPKFSAKKVKGERAYTLARKKQEFDLEPKKVKIYSLSLVNLKQDSFELNMECSKGTYVRTLVVDIARALGTFATPVSLKRLGIGGYTLEDAVALDNLDIEKDLININDVEL